MQSTNAQSGSAPPLDVTSKYLAFAALSARAPSIDEQKERNAALQRREEAESQSGSAYSSSVRHVAGGMQTVAARYGCHNSASAREERLAALDRLEDDALAHEPPSFHWSSAAAASACEDSTSSIDRPLPSSNIGFRLLLRMGWGGMGCGLGRRGTGIAEPIRMDTESGALGMGLGKKAEMEAAGDEATAQRKTSALEAQAKESELQRSVRETAAAQAARITHGATAAISAMRCDDCDKQYSIATEYEAHLSSYDHNHTVRIKDLRRSENARKLAALNAAQATAAAAGGATTTAVSKRQQKEDARLEAQMKAATEAAAAATAAASTSVAPVAAYPTAPISGAAPFAPRGPLTAAPGPAAVSGSGVTPFSFSSAANPKPAAAASPFVMSVKPITMGSSAATGGGGGGFGAPRPVAPITAAPSLGFGLIAKKPAFGSTPLSKPKFAFSTDD